jgi:hypothetical protein
MKLLRNSMETLWRDALTQPLPKESFGRITDINSLHLDIVEKLSGASLATLWGVVLCRTKRSRLFVVLSSVFCNFFISSVQMYRFLHLFDKYTKRHKLRNYILWWKEVILPLLVCLNLYVQGWMSWQISGVERIMPTSFSPGCYMSRKLSNIIELKYKEIQRILHGASHVLLSLLNY